MRGVGNPWVEGTRAATGIQSSILCPTHPVAWFSSTVIDGSNEFLGDHKGIGSAILDRCERDLKRHGGDDAVQPVRIGHRQSPFGIALVLAPGAPRKGNGLRMGGGIVHRGGSVRDTSGT